VSHYLRLGLVVLVVSAVVMSNASAEISKADFDAMQKQLADIQTQLNKERAASAAEIKSVKGELSELRQHQVNVKGAESTVIREVETTLTPNAIPGQPVTTAIGKMKIGGLVQVWYYAIERDREGLYKFEQFDDFDHNIGVSQSTFQVRRAEINFTMDIHENVTAFMMADFARESDSVRGQFANLAGNNQGFIKGNTVVASQILGKDLKIGSPAGSAPAILQDAIINFHDVIPHHDISLGQMLPYFSQEEFAPNGHLDFVERSWIGNFVQRDLGAVIHGSCWGNGGGSAYQGAGDAGRFQYWLGVFDSAGYYQDATTQSRPDNNASKDFLGRVMVRPLWNDCMGHLELSGAFGLGRHGSTPLDQAILAVNSSGSGPAIGGFFINGTRETFGRRASAYVDYKAGDFAKGLWTKFEYMWIHDSCSNIPQTTSLFNTTDLGHYEPFSSTGFYASAGYRLSESNYSQCLPCWAQGFEFNARFQRYTNVWTQNNSNAYKVETFATKQGTLGINYYLVGQNAKIQMNYDIVRDPKGQANARFHAVKNDFFSMSFQVMW